MCLLNQDKLYKNVKQCGNGMFWLFTDMKDLNVITVDVISRLLWSIFKGGIRFLLAHKKLSLIVISRLMQSQTGGLQVITLCFFSLIDRHEDVLHLRPRDDQFRASQYSTCKENLFNPSELSLTRVNNNRHFREKFLYDKYRVYNGFG